MVSNTEKVSILKRENVAYRMSVKTLEAKLEATRKVVEELRAENKKLKFAADERNFL